MALTCKRDGAGWEISGNWKVVCGDCAGRRHCGWQSRFEREHLTVKLI